jgi:hypothetical protein
MQNRRHTLLTVLALLLLLAPLGALQPAYAQSGGGDSQPAAASGSSGGSSGGSAASGNTSAGTTTVSVHHSETWYANPLWIVIGLVALALIIGLVVASGRSRNTTTVIKD